ncbi:hypothetical protein ACP4OV_015718 [Aristida adscensionis]
MARFSCFSGLLGGKRKRSKVTNKVAHARKANGNDCPKVKPVEFMDMVDTVDVKKSGDNATARDAKAVVHAAAEPARQGRDENVDLSIKKDSSDAVLAAGAGSSGYSSDGTVKTATGAGADAGESCGVGRVAATASPKLKRSCSNIETARSAQRGFDLPAMSRSYDDLKRTLALPDESPTPSVKTSFSADRAMLKKRSSRQVLPSRSRKLWRRLFLWSDGNLHRPGPGVPVPMLPPADTDGTPHQHDGHTSDMVDAVTVVTADAKNKAVAVEEGPIPSQWVAFCTEASSLDRVRAWVNTLEGGAFHAAGEEDGVTEHDGGGAARPSCPEVGESSASAAAKSHAHAHAQAKRRAADEAVRASSIVQTLSTFTSVGHISGMGLKAVPMISVFASLRAVNLSGNLIAHISPGSLPRGLHTLDLSRNKIAVIDGLRELTRLRVLNLSYNGISRIGRGLSSCTAIRELYLAGNKISDVEGLHRLLKLAVLDVSFNRVTTARSLGQLVANYHSLRALNLAGNPVQANVGDETLRRAVSGLLPRLEYLSRQPLRPQRAREAAKDSVAQAALGNAGAAAARGRAPRRGSQGAGSAAAAAAAKSRGRDVGGGRRGSRGRSKSRAQSSSLARK